MEKRDFTPKEIYGPKNAMGYPEKMFTAPTSEVKSNKKASKRVHKR